MEDQNSKINGINAIYLPCQNNNMGPREDQRVHSFLRWALIHFNFLNLKHRVDFIHTPHNLKEFQ